MTNDRIVHGWMADGTEIVRYDRAGKYYLEPPPNSGRRRRQVTCAQAARAAVLGKPVLGRTGGSAFDRVVRRLQSQPNEPMDDRPKCDGCGRVIIGPVTNVGDSMEVVLLGSCCLPQPTGPHAKPLSTSPEPAKSGPDSSHMDHEFGSQS